MIFQIKKFSQKLLLPLGRKLSHIPANVFTILSLFFSILTGLGFYYDHEDGFLDEYMPGDGEWPTEGTLPWTFMVIGNGEKVTFKALLKAYTDENGDLIFKIERYKIDCN